MTEGRYTSHIRRAHSIRIEFKGSSSEPSAAGARSGCVRVCVWGGEGRGCTTTTHWTTEQMFTQTPHLEGMVLVVVQSG